MKKKITIFTSVIVILFAALLTTASAKTFPDVEGKPYERAVETLKAFGILMGKSEDNFDPDSTITRAEMVAIAMRLSGWGELVQTDTVFDDVPKSHWASGLINMAEDLEYVTGVTDTMFYPDNSVTYEEAVAILLRILGYEVMAQNMGGFPKGYMDIGYDKDLLDGAGTASGNAPRWAVAQMAYNALEVEMYDITETSGENASYGNLGRTILKDKLKMNRSEGIVSANGVTSINPDEDSVGESMVKINDVIHDVGETDIADYLGYYVDFYYRDDFNASDDGEIKLFFVEDNKTEVLEIKYDEKENTIEYKDNTLNITYLKGSSQREESVPDSHFIYNGMAATPDEINTYFMPKLSGGNFTMTLIDNDGDGKYNVISVRDYNSYLVKNVNEYGESIRCKKYSPSQPENIELEGVEYKVYDERNREIGLSDIAINNVISVFSTIDNSRCDIYVSVHTVEGAITSIQEDECVINSSVYEFSSDLSMSFMTGIFYMDIYGKIIGYDELVMGTGNYGMLLNVYYDSSIDECFYKILTSDGEIITYTSEPTVTAYNPATDTVEETSVKSLIYTGKTSVGYTTAEEKYALWHTDNADNFIEAATLTDYTAPFYSCLFLSDSEKSAAASRKPVYYELDSDSKIRKILVPDVPGETKLQTLNNAGRYSYTYRSAYGMVFDSENNTTATPYFRIDDTATVFSVLATDYKDQNYSASKGMGRLQNGIANKMRLYSTDNTQNAGIVVNYSVFPDEGMANTPYVVVRHMGVDDQGNYILYGWSEGKEYTATIIDGTRLIERKPNFSSSQYTDDTKLNSQNIADASLIRPYDASTIEALIETAGNSVPIGADTLKAGDIVIVGKNGGSDICYVEMAMRAEDGVMLITSSQSSYYARMAGADYLGKGIVSEITEENEFLVDIVGEYNSANRRQISLPENYRYTLFFNDKNVPYAFENAGNVWIYDYENGSAEVVNSSAIEEGDTVMIRGAAAKPKDCIILKNYPW